MPVCFAVEGNPQAPPRTANDKHQLHGADDLITLFELKPLWERSVKPYTASSRAKQKEQASAVKSETVRSVEGGGTSPSQKSGDAGSTRSAITNEPNKPLVMEKTYVNYVRNLPGTWQYKRQGEAVCALC